MTDALAEHALAHGDWATATLLEACLGLDAEVLDATPGRATWSVRRTLRHLVESQCAYLSLLTRPVEDRAHVDLELGELPEAARRSGEGLRAVAARLARGEGAAARRTTDGYRVEPWVVLVQAVNHADDHRRQVCELLRAQGIDPPRLDGWAFGEVTGALVPDAP